MNSKQDFIDKLKIFLESDDKVMLITATHQYKKHKILVAFLDEKIA